MFVVVKDRHRICQFDMESGRWVPRRSEQKQHQKDGERQFQFLLECHKQVYINGNASITDLWDTELTEDDLIEIEEITFWLFLGLMEVIPDYHVSTLVGARVAQSVLDHFVETFLPDMMSHIVGMEMTLSLITMQWFFSLYLTDLSPEAGLQVCV